MKHAISYCLMTSHCILKSEASVEHQRLPSGLTMLDGDAVAPASELQKPSFV